MATMVRRLRVLQWSDRFRLGSRPRPARRLALRPVGRTVRAVLDTSLVVATDVGPLDEDLAVSAATLAELHFGVLVASRPAVRAERLRRVSLIQRVFDPLP